MKHLMRLPNELAGFAPEADLRTVTIRRRDSLAQADDTKLALARSELPDGLFFAKGLASTEGFRPSYWSYGKARDIEANDACAVVEAQTDEARSSGPLTDRAPPDTSPDDGEFSRLEREFLELHRQALTQEPEPDSSAPGNPDFRAPLADLRTVQLRRSRRDAARVDELLVRKRPPGAAQTGDDAGAIELPSQGDLAPAAEPLHAAEERAGAADAPRIGIDGGPDDALGAETGRSNGAARDAASKPAGTGRKSAVSPVQVAVIVFGCVALLASLGVFIPSDAPPPRADVAVQRPQAAAPDAPPVSDAVANLLARGDERLRSGDVIAARLFYEKAADAGNAHGALMMGAMYDPKFLASIGVYGLRGDEKAALAWYRRAGELGDPEAAKLAQDLPRQ